MTIKEMDSLLKEVPVEQLPKALEPFLEDTRGGVKKLVAKYQKHYHQHMEACEAWQMRLAFDDVMGEGKVIVGIDEVGRGPLAGPVVAAAVILPKDVQIVGLRDSKKLSEAKRELLYHEIREKALAVGVGIVDAARIDEINILQATFEAMRQALTQIGALFDKILVDGDKIIPGIAEKQEAIISGDDKSAAIGAASVIAKVTRDRMMVEYAKLHPGYDWESNKGYGSQKHYEGIRSLGMTPLHRRSFLKNEGIM